MSKEKRTGGSGAKSPFKPRTKKPNFILSVILTTAKMMFVVALVVGVSLTGALVGVAKAWVETMPALDLSRFDEQAQTSYLYDKNGDLITDFKGTENRVDATYEELPKILINAVIASEDQRFWSHNGVDLRRLLGSIVSNLSSGGSQGGSTITQQLIKKTFLSDEQTYKRKLQEAYMALELEKQISKEDIITEYLNVVYFGGSNYGVKVAAMDYFGKELSQLNLRECACLAKLINKPYKLNPRRCYYVTGKPELIEDEVDNVLRKMKEQGLITEAEYTQALGERLTVLEHSTSSSSELVDNMYYVEYAIYDVVTKMLHAENLEDNSTNRALMENKLRTGGYSIYTELDPEMQDAVQSVITGWDKYPKMRSSADSVYRASLGNGEYLERVQPQAACTVIDWHTGAVVAIVGGRSTPTGWKQKQFAYNFHMPIGSSIKPLSIYGPAFDLGNSPGSPVLNLPIQISGWDSDTGYPQNYGGASYTGVESLRMAINQSHNTAAAQALYSYVGVDNSVNYLLRLGISADSINATGAGLALGSSGISTVELAGGFAAIANGGVYQEPYAFSRVLNPDGTVYLDVGDVQITREAFKESTAWMLVDVLVEACQTGTGKNANFGNFTVGGKTGTNSDYRGVTFAGFTAYYAAAVWVGSEDYKPLVSGASGGTYAAPLWAAVMSKVHSQAGITEDGSIRTKSAAEVGLVQATVCAVSGMLPTDACYNDVNGYGTNTDYYLFGTEPVKTCNMHRTVKLCTVTMKPASSSCSSRKTYGVIYLPEGHPLRNGVSTVVQEYFSGASTDPDATSMEKCTVCANGADSTYSYANRYLDRAAELIENGEITSEQIERLQKASDNLRFAMNAGDVDQVKTMTSTLRSLVKAYE